MDLVADHIAAFRATTPNERGESYGKHRIIQELEEHLADERGPGCSSQLFGGGTASGGIRAFDSRTGASARRSTIWRGCASRPPRMER
jgi:hypothetical protein